MKHILRLLTALLLAPQATLDGVEMVAPAPGSAEWTRSNLFNDSNTAWNAGVAGAEQPLPLRSLVPPVLLPDGSEFRTWEPSQPVQPRRTFVVAQRHPHASDDNPGSDDRPWKTIGRAAKVLEPGDRLVVREGLYREWIRPARGGTGPERILSGLGLIGGLVEDNYSRDCGWRRVQGLHESGGIKLHYLKHTLVRRNVVQGTTSADGLWVDHSNHNSRITQNIVTGAEGNAFYLEASYGPNLVDHNIFWGSSGEGMLLAHTGHATIAHNLVGCCRGQPVQIALARPLPTGRMVDLETKRFSSSDHNRLIGNMFYGFESRGPKIPGDMDNESDYNLFINPSTVSPFDLSSWLQKTGFDQHSHVAVATLEFSPHDGTLRGLLPTLECSRLGPITRDYFDVPRSGATSDVGPFLKLNLKPGLLLLPKRAGNEKRP